MKILGWNDPALFIHLPEDEELLDLARRVEEMPRDLPLWGIPFVVKDNIDVAGWPTTAACPDFRYVPQQDAEVVRLLRAAGAIPIGKTNLDQFATGLVGTRSPYGVPRNAHAPEYLPGGSSSGSASAVAAGLCVFSLGTDTAGSGRVPAAFQELVGWKPTRGLLSNRGRGSGVPFAGLHFGVCEQRRGCRDDQCRGVTIMIQLDAFSRKVEAAGSTGARFRFGVPRELDFSG